MALHLTDEQQAELVENFTHLAEGFKRLGDILHDSEDGGHGVTIANAYQEHAENCADEYA